MVQNLARCLTLPADPVPHLVSLYDGISALPGEIFINEKECNEDAEPSRSNVTMLYVCDGGVLEQVPSLSSKYDHIGSPRRLSLGLGPSVTSDAFHAWQAMLLPSPFEALSLIVIKVEKSRRLWSAPRLGPRVGPFQGHVSLPLGRLARVLLQVRL